jgi:Domain of unknown function (DUF222)
MRGMVLEPKEWGAFGGLPHDCPREITRDDRDRCLDNRTCVRYSDRYSPRDLKARSGLHHQDDELIKGMDAQHAHVCAGQRKLFRFIAQADRSELWRDSGARDFPHWLCMRYGISDWKARRWIAAAHALEGLPLLSEAFASGELGVDKVVELTRFATAETEGRLIRWAQGVSCGAIRHKGDLAVRSSLEEVADVDRTRFLSWWYFDEGRRFGLEAELPAAQGAVVARALERLDRFAPGDAGGGGRGRRRRQTSRCPGGDGLCPDRGRSRPGSGHRHRSCSLGLTRRGPRPM